MDEELNRPCQFDKSFTEVAKKYDVNLGEYKIMKSNVSDQLVLVKEHQTTAKSQALKILASLAQRKELKVPHLMNLLDFSCRDDSHFCGNFYNYRSYYEYYKTSLSTFKDNACKSQLGLSTITLTKLLYDMVDVLAGLQQMNIIHGDVRPELIFVSRFQDESDADFKLLDRVSERGTAIETQLNNVVSANSLYLSPSYYDALSSGKIKSLSSEAFKADVFSLGIVILEIGLLVSVQGVYDNMKNKFNTFVLEKLLEQFRKKYGRNSLITEVTYLMLQTDDTLRPDFLNLKERLPPYSQVQQFIMSEGNQQPTSRLHQAAPNVVMEKASYVENPMSMKDSAPLKPFIKSDQIEAIAPRLPGQDTQYEYPSRQKNGLGMEEIHNQGTRHINNQNQPYHIENYNQGNGDFKRGTTDSEVQKNRRDPLKPQAPALKKRRKLFEDAELASNPLPRDHADTPAREHTEESYHSIQKKGYYGQSPHDMVYNNWKGSPALTTEPSFARQIGAQNQSPMQIGNNEPWPTPNSVHSAGALHMGNPDARLHQPDSVNNDQKFNSFSRLNSQPNNHPGNYEDIYMMQRPPVRPEQQQISNNFNNQPRMQGQNSNGFPHKNLSNMIMQENNDNWQLQQAQMPSKIKQQTSNDSLNESRRGVRREGPLSMLRSPPRNGRQEAPIHPPQPIMTNFRKNNEIGQSPQVFMTPKSIPGSPPIAGQSGPNKFAPLVQNQMPKPPQSTGFQSNQRANSNQPPSKAHEFFSNDPMLRNMANQYY